MPPRPPRLPSLSALVAFEAIARLASFTRAAEELCVTRSAVSHRLKELEDELGVTLIDRGARPPAPTPAGRAYLATVRASLAAIAQAGASAAGGETGHRIIVASPPTFAREVIAPRLAAFHRAHPGVEIAIELTIPLRDVRGADADVEIRFGGGVYPDYVTLDLLDEPVFAVCAPAYAREHALAAPAALARAQLLRSSLEPWAPWFAAAGLRLPEPAQGPRYEDLALLYQAAADGEGVALARASLVHALIERGALTRLFAVEARSPHAYYVVARPAALARADIAAFIDWLRTAVAPRHSTR